MSQLPDSDPFSLDDRLRSTYAADDAASSPTPPARLRIWADLQPHLHPVAAPAPRSAARPALLGGTAGALVGALLMWSALTDQPATSTGAAPSAEPASRTAVAATGTGLRPTGAELAVGNVNQKPDDIRLAAGDVQLPVGSVRLLADGTNRKPGAAKLVVGGAGLLVNSVGLQAAEAVLPAVLLPLIAVETTHAAFTATDSSAETRAGRRRALLAERAALAALTRRADSLLLTLGELPEAPLALAAAPVPPTDSAAPAPFRRWSVALSFAPERNFFGLNAPAGDTLNALRRTHEQGRSGYNANVGVEYRVSDRLSVGARLGVASYGAELRLTESRTRISTHFDSATTINASVTTVTTRAYAIRPVPDSILAPILNVNQQVIGYQYLPTTRLDTVWTYLTLAQNDTVIKTKYLPYITTRQETSARILRPNYRFLTVPLLVRYRLGRAQDWTSSPTAPRWWADVAVGAQLQWFLGGTQATTRDGLTYHTARVGPTGGPFRPLNVALTGQVAVNYALTPRLSASLAPTLRYQVASVYKPSTNLTQRPTATGVQLGLRFAF